MLRERRTKHVEYRGVMLADKEQGLALPDGSLVVPMGVVAGEVTYGVPDVFSSDAPYVAMAKPLFSEAGKFDTEETGKTVVLEGAIEIESDQFIAADESSMVFGAGLTVKKEAGVLKFGVASGANVVICKVAMPPADHPEGRLVVSGTFR